MGETMGDKRAGAGAAFDPQLQEEIEKRYWREIWRTAVHDAVEEMRIDLARFGPVQAAIVASEPEQPMLNMILGAGGPAAVGGGHLQDAVEWVESHGVDYRVPVTPGRPETGPAERWLMESGHEQGAGRAKFLRDVSPPSFPEPPGIEILELGDEPGESETFADLMVAGLGSWWCGTFYFGLQAREDWRGYLALGADEEPLACAAMLIHGGAAELGPVAPLRGEGGPQAARCQDALLRRCILDATAAGCGAVFAEAEAPELERTAAGRRHLLGVGFEQAFMRPDWRPARAAVDATRSRRLWYV